MASSPIARPSVSPLSPVEHRGMLDADLDASDSAVPIEDADGNGDVDLGDDGSSSLSEPEDAEDDFHTAAAPRAALAAHGSVDVDSEAETERLEQTPDKARLQTHHEHDRAGRTPSKLVHVHAASVDDDDALDDLSEPPSPIPTLPGGASSTNTADNAGKKRKRSNSAGSSLSSPQSDSEESPRKRSYSSVENETALANEPVAVATIEDAVDDTVPAAEDVDVEADTALAANLPKPGKRKGGRPKGKGKKEAVKESEVEPVDSIPLEGEASEDAAAKVHKQPASTAFDDIAKQFALYRQRAQKDRLAELDAELAMLATKGECKHPEYLRQVACVDARYAKQVDEARAFRRFKIESIRRTTLGERSQLHSQYFQQARELRENVMVELGKDWYSIQKERRQINQSNDELYMRKFPAKKSVQMVHQAKYNQEVSVLSGVAKYVGFPAAPEVNGTEGDALDDDLRAMKITKHAAVPIAQPVYFPHRTNFLQTPTDRAAHEQFIEQNPWARPQGPIMNHGIHGTPGLTHTPDWQSGSGEREGPRHMVRNMVPAVNRPGSPYATPNSQRRALAEHSSAGTAPANSGSVEIPPSSAAPPSERAAMHYFPPRDMPAKASPLVVPKARQNGGERELTGFRNISNISGASTIDAPDSAEKDLESAARRDVLPGLPADASAPLHPFDTSQLHRRPLSGNGVKRNIPDTYPNASFRPQDGAFGTPTPLPTGSGQQ